MPRAARAAVVAALALVLGVSGAAASTSGPVVTLNGPTVGDSSISVTGNAVFSGPTSAVGTDAAGDNVIPGTDLRSASITPISSTQLRFDLAVGDLPAATNGTPEAVNYWWEFRVVKGASVSEFGLQAWRSSTAADVTCGVIFACPPGSVGAPRFQLSTCTPDPTTGQRTCSAEPVAGSLANGVFSWTVPLSMINAAGGADIVPATTASGVQVPIAASHGVSGISWSTNGSSAPVTINGTTARAGDLLTWQPYTYSRTLTLGIAPAGTPASDVETVTPAATIASNGNFTGSLPRPEAGEYTVVARACVNDTCSAASQPVTVP